MPACQLFPPDLRKRIINPFGNGYFPGSTLALAESNRLIKRLSSPL